MLLPHGSCQFDVVEVGQHPTLRPAIMERNMVGVHGREEAAGNINTWELPDEAYPLPCRPMHASCTTT